MAVVGLLALITLYVVNCPTTSWVSFCLGAFALPLLLWLAARCQPTFAMVGTFVVSIIVIYATTAGLGHFGDETIPIWERAKGTQAAVTTVSIYTLVLTALLTERRSREEGLRRLLEALPTAIHTRDTTGRITYCNQAAVDLWGKRPEFGKDTRHNLYRLNYPDGTPMPDAKYPFQICMTERRKVAALEALLERADGKRIPIIPYPAPLFDELGRLVGAVIMQIDISERKALEEQQNLLVAELDHRVKNMLAVVSAVVDRTQETSVSMADFVTSLGGRLKSMASTHELLTHRRWYGVLLAELVQRELAPYATAGNTKIQGPEEILSAKASQAMAMVFHELATNAAKFGALSSANGHVSVRWGQRRNGHAQSRLSILWEERGGPNVPPQTQSGYGTELIRDLIPYELGGTVDLVHAPEGVRCELEILIAGSVVATR